MLILAFEIMRLTNLKVLSKLKKKSIGNVKLIKAIDQLIDDLEKNEFASFEELKKIRNDADKVHADGFCFFDIHIHRTMIMLEFDEEECTVVWAGTHDEYESTFKNNKSTIEKWLKDRGYLE
jgi:mRNA-degrading endonuclease HigB of HigAB toxin-antitoxin module